jgi:hypothetical protein
VCICAATRVVHGVVNIEPPHSQLNLHFGTTLCFACKKPPYFDEVFSQIALILN